MLTKITKNSGYYAVIPAEVRYDNTLNAQTKLLYAEITALCRAEGYCWASNEYFAELYGVNTTTIWRWIKSLENKRYIAIDRERLNNGRLSFRKIYLCFDEESEASTSDDSDHIAKMQCGKDSHIAKMQCGESDQIAKMQCGVEKCENKAKNEFYGLYLDEKEGSSGQDTSSRQTTLQNCNMDHIAKMQSANNVNNINFKYINSLQKKRARARTQFHTARNAREEHKEEDREIMLYGENCVICVGRVSDENFMPDIARARTVWQKVSERLELEINSLSYDVWLRPIEPLGFIGRAIVLKSVTEGSAEEVFERFLDKIDEYVKAVTA